ncbi:MAG: antibiotic biosynthesis monooxygenase family protein [Cardiobacteriaceae bacterium]|nr:antibiotic biosynthesis monooxygenase family protein [Cardiobacteriaceae bacterium]
MIRKKASLFVLASLLAACHQAPADENVILINAFRVAPGQEDAALAAWRKARDFLQTQPGYLDTRLHKNLDPEGEFLFVNIARWQSVEDFHAATARMRQALPDNRVPGVHAHPGLFQWMAEESR